MWGEKAVFCLHFSFFVTPFFFASLTHAKKEKHIVMRTLTVRTTRAYGSPEREKKDDDDDDATMWHPKDFDDFNDGGAYPEIFAVQFPNEIGWRERESRESSSSESSSSSSSFARCPPSLPVDFETLLRDSTEMMLRVSGNVATTDAHDSYKAFVRAFEEDAEAKEIAKFGSLREAKSIEVVDNDTVDALKFESEFVACENGVGRPCVVRNVFKVGLYDVDLLDLFPEETLTVNDKAPARRTDKGATKQNTLLVTAKRYKEYMEDYDNCDDDVVPAPFYNNGWRIFSTNPEKVNSYFENMHPRFTRAADETESILRETFKFLVKSSSAPHMYSQVDEMTANVSRSLNKAFIGPAGCITRLHFDAQNAHGFLAQTKGRKLFVLFHPSADVDATNCCSSEDEQTEMNQSLIDPLRYVPEKARKHLYACVVEENEAIFIPHKWWHYAVSLDSSHTIMRNFFHSKTNVEGLVTMVTRSLANSRSRLANSRKPAKARQ